MNYTVFWTVLSKQSFNEEVEFILFKWNYDEVFKFIELVEETLETIAIQPTIGQYNPNKNIYSFVISKQTTLFYKINEADKQIELSLFWNNSQNPSQLDKLIKLI